MHKSLLRDTLGWGFILWLIGYALGIILFTLVPAQLIGWIILPLGTALTVWVLLTKISLRPLSRYLVLSLSWLAIAVLGDYFFLVQAFHPEDGYYKPDVYLYYAATFALPLLVGWYRQQVKRKS